MPLKPYVYVATGVSRDVQRNAPDGARVAIHYPELGRTVELWTDADGRFSLDVMPSPMRSGETIGVARGELGKAEEGDTIRVYPAFDPIVVAEGRS